MSLMSLAPVVLVVAAVGLYFGYRSLIKGEPPEHVDLYGGGDPDSHRSQTHISGR